MRFISRFAASTLGFSLVLSACGGHGGSPLPATDGTSNASSSTRSAAGASTATTAALIAVPRTFGRLAFTDTGRRSASAPVSVSLTLAYNHQAELDAFVDNVSDPNSAGYRQFLTPDAFDAYYAPTPLQEETVVRSLQRAGFTIEQRFSNRTIVDATAPSATVERYFATEMHTLQQGKYGERFANLKPAFVPAAIAPLVRTVSLSNVVIAQTVADQDASVASDQVAPGANCSGQLLANPGFESGNVKWTATSGVIKDDKTHASAGSWFAFLDGATTAKTETLEQTVTIPAGCRATLAYVLEVGTNETSTSTLDTLALAVNGTTEQSFSNRTTTGGTYVTQKVDLSAFAGKSVTVLWTSKQTGSKSTSFFIDTTSLSLSAAPTPTPKPTVKPTATPSPKPTATPTVKPTSTPVATSCKGTASDEGPLSNSSGTLATGVAKPFDFPVQHGCNGAGYTAAVVIDDPINTGFVASYLSASGVKESGTISNVAVDGGGSGEDVETDLDVETIAGLAPGANIIVYHIGSLTDQAIEDAYNKAISDKATSVVNSSFGGCESSDTPFESSTNAIAQQGAAVGVTFAASSGDTGSDECGNLDTKGVSAPAGDPYFTSIGGVNFTYSSAGVLQSITAGAASCGNASGACYGGGGVSTVVALPKFQTGISGMITSGRNQPDISLPFDPVAVYTGSGFGSYLGTSWSSPAAVALFVETNELHGSKIGWVNPSLYSVFAASGYSADYTPCTSGNNIAYSCAASHYNQAAGIGAPKGFALAKAL